MAQKILIVDDDPVARHIVHTVLKANGYVTTIASDGMGALAETQRQKPDLVILDLGLPAGGGLTYLQRKRSIPPISMIPVLVISGQDRAANEKRAMEAGASGYMEKPADGDAVLAKVRELIGP
jgi:DNA-binding response OmpR family regulator